MGMIEKELIKEIQKWTDKATEKRKNLKLLDDSDDFIIKNIDAYIKDSKFFLEKGDLIKSFEAIIWSWSFIELGIHMKVLENVGKHISEKIEPE